MGQLLAVLARLSHDSGQWTGTQTELAKCCSLNRRTLQRRLKVARDTGEIVVSGRPGQKLTYSIAVAVEPAKTSVTARTRRKRPFSPIDLLSAIMTSIWSIPHSKRKGKRSDDRRQLYLDFEKGYNSGRKPDSGSFQTDKPVIRSVTWGSSAVGSTDAGTPDVGCFAPIKPAERRPDSSLMIRQVNRGPVRRSFPIFFLPRDTTREQLHSATFVQEHVVDQAIALKLATPDEVRHLFALVGRVVRSELKTPAALLIYILRGGQRKVPWRADLADVDWQFADRMVRELVPSELKQRSSNLDDEAGRIIDANRERRRVRRLLNSRRE